VLLPAKASRPLISRLHREVAAIVKKQDVQEKLIALGFEPEGNSPEEYAAQIRSELAKWAKVVKIANVQVE
jgi:tripartite-type tricarboxylate transporter receptor subunit TctC